jgi:hypothetical protein
VAASTECRVGELALQGNDNAAGALQGAEILYTASFGSRLTATPPQPEMTLTVRIELFERRRRVSDLPLPCRA